MNRTALLVGLAGFFGTICRYLLASAFSKAFDKFFPYSPLAINILGCFLIGMVYAVGQNANLLSNETRKILAIGFCGGFTTFSAFAFENVKLLNQSLYITVITYCLVSVVLGIAAVVAGNSVGKLFI